MAATPVFVPCEPDEWESDVVLADGGTVHLRRIRTDDDERLLRLYERLSGQSLYLRYFSPVSAPTAAPLAYLTVVDGAPSRSPRSASCR